MPSRPRPKVVRDPREVAHEIMEGSDKSVMDLAKEHSEQFVPQVVEYMQYLCDETLWWHEAMGEYADENEGLGTDDHLNHMLDALGKLNRSAGLLHMSLVRSREMAEMMYRITGQHHPRHWGDIGKRFGLD